MRSRLQLAASLLLIAFPAVADPPRPPEAVLGLVEEVATLAAGDLWPGFDARQVPLALYDGENTWLFGHPGPPEGFSAVDGHPDLEVFRGRHPEVRANTSIELAGAGTATADISGGSKSAAARAGLLIHEAFHVFQDRRHPGWGANEAELFLYPLEDVRLLQLRRLETLALSRAVSSQAPDDAVRWARAALRIRAERFEALPEGSVLYERGTERKEGLARYVEHRAVPLLPSTIVPADGFAVDRFRERGYSTGLAFGLLLDRFDPGWRDRFEAGELPSLDQELGGVLETAEPSGSAPFAAGEEEAAARRATADIGALVEARGRTLEEFLGRDGWRLEIVVEGGEPLWPGGFDPLNVERLSGSELMHRRWLRLNNSAAELEVLDRTSLSEACGRHPLFEGVCKLTLTGLTERPEPESVDGELVLAVPGFDGRFRGGRMETSGRSVRLLLGSPPPGASATD